MSFVGELRRRNVVRVAIFYAVASWLILQLADVIGSLLKLPDWTGKLVVLLLVLGLPVALVISWVYEITPEGLARTSAVDPARSIAPQTGRRLDLIIIAALGLAIALLIVDRFLARDTTRPQAATATAQPGTPVDTKLRTIAVLPFVNMSNDPANEYFSDGMSEEILNTLARIDGLQLAARTASFQFKGRATDIADIGRRLNVGAVLEGSVRRAGDSVRISAQLVDVSNGYRIWSKSFDRSSTDVFAVQTEIANEIADALQLELRAANGAAAAGVRGLPTQDPRAYELFLQGRYLWRQRNGPGIERAIALLEEAIRLDPRFAEAYAALASALFVLQNYVSVDALETRRRTSEAASKALALDGTLAEAVAVQASLLDLDGQWSRAEQTFQHAIELAPDEATPHHWLALHYLQTGRLREFSTEADRAYALDPANAAIAGLPGIARHLEGDFAAAIRHYELAASMGGAFSLVNGAPHAYYDAGQPEKAVEAARRGYARLGLDVGLADTVRAAVAEPARRPEARRAILGEPRAYYTANYRISDLLLIGEFEQAVNEARNAPDAEARDLLLHAWHKSAAGLRRSPAFKQFVREQGLLDYWRKRGWPDLCRPAGQDFVCD